MGRRSKVGRLAFYRSLLIACFVGLSTVAVQAESAVESSLTAEQATPLGPAIRVGRDQDIVGTLVSVETLRQLQSKTAITAGTNLGRGEVPRGFPLRSGVLTSSFGMRPHPILGGYRGHGGVDLAAPAGSPVFATGPGRVINASWSGGYGLLVTIDHGGGKQSRYGHLSAATVTVGQTVPAGAVVGLVGSTGLATGPHLHYEIRVNGSAVDPVRVAR